MMVQSSTFGKCNDFLDSQVWSFILQRVVLGILLVGSLRYARLFMASYRSMLHGYTQICTRQLHACRCYSTLTQTAPIKPAQIWHIQKLVSKFLYSRSSRNFLHLHCQSIQFSRSSCRISANTATDQIYRHHSFTVLDLRHPRNSISHLAAARNMASNHKSKWLRKVQTSFKKVQCSQSYPHQTGMRLK